MAPLPSVMIPAADVKLFNMSIVNMAELASSFSAPSRMFSPRSRGNFKRFN
jgi:hypothetical protein